LQNALAPLSRGSIPTDANIKGQDKGRKPPGSKPNPRLQMGSAPRLRLLAPAIPEPSQSSEAGFTIDDASIDSYPDSRIYQG
jgi:hypothetical protein